MSEEKQKYAWLINAIPLLLGVGICAPFLILIAYTFPSSDDFADFRFVREYGYQTAFAKYYFEWGGRYFSVGLTFLLNTIGYESMIPYRLVCLLSFGLLVLLCWLITLIFQILFLLQEEIFSFFIVILILVLGYMPSPVEMIYWFTGSWVYLPGLVMIACWTLLALRKEPLQGWRHWCFIILPLCMAGSNEVIIVLFAGIWFIVWVNQKTTKKAMIWPLILFVIGASIALLAPGNHVRHDFFLHKAGNPAGNVYFSIKHAFLTLWHWGRDWSRSTPIIIAGIVLYQLSGIAPGSDIPLRKKMRVAIPAIFTLIALTLPFFWGTGRNIPALRVMNIYWIAFSITVLSFVAAAMNHFSLRQVKQPVITRMLFLVLIASLTYQSNWRQAIDDLQIVAEYRDQMNQRIDQARKASETDTLVFNPMMYMPSTISYIDLNENPGHWYNKGFAYRYRIAAVRVSNDIEINTNNR
jgi:hypothetical protein